MIFADFDRSYLLFKNMKIVLKTPIYHSGQNFYNLFDEVPNTPFVYEFSDNDLAFEIKTLNKEIIHSIIIEFCENCCIEEIEKNIKIYKVDKGIVPVKMEKVNRELRIHLSPGLNFFVIKFTNIKLQDWLCINDIGFYNGKKENILCRSKYFLFSSGDNYPNQYLYDKQLHLFKKYKIDLFEHDLSPEGFSYNGDKFCFLGGEIENYGFVIYDFKKQSDKQYFAGKAITHFKWIDDNTVYLEWVEIQGEERKPGETTLKID
jgi:hypothetical protein